MKVIAMYLPQFHRIKENDEWWGEGFTDWISTKMAKPLFKGHYQPHIPLDENYYDLSKVETLQWQATVMNKYGVDALCFYHYYFEKGKMILEKPAELLLNNKEIKIPFCFCWANETWARSWSGIKGANSWSEEAEDGLKKGNGILLNQSYGDEVEWTEHFNYLLPFFRDERYLKINGQPVFLFYRTKLIDCMEKMTITWNVLAKENGIEKIYYIANDPAPGQLRFVDAELYHEPVKSNTLFIENQYSDKEKHVAYEELWNEILRTPFENRKIYYGGFVSYDDTPRRGKRGIVVTGANPQVFGKKLSLLMKKNQIAGNEFTFINAWNEWGEGMHLEPDIKYGYGFLENVLKAKSEYNDVCFFNGNNEKHMSQVIKRCEKFELYLNDLDMWMSLRELGVSLSEYFICHPVRSIAVYGYGIMGRHFVTELVDLFDVFVIDKQGCSLGCTVPVFMPCDAPYSDVTVVASYYFYDNVRKELCERPNIISLGDVIHWMWSEKKDGE